MSKPLQNLSCFISACLISSVLLPANAQSIGSRVLASPFSMENQWFAGTVVGENAGAIVVKLDKRPDHDNEVYSVQKKWIKPGGGQPPADWNKINSADATFYGIGTPEQLTLQAAANGNTVPNNNNPANTAHAPIANPHIMPKGMSREDLERYGVETNTHGQKRYANTAWGRQLQQLHQQEGMQLNGTTSTIPQRGVRPDTAGNTGGGLVEGSRVLASPFSDPNQWFPGTIVKALDGGKNGFVVRLDQKPGVNYQDTFQMNEKWVKPGGGTAPPNREGIDPNLGTFYGLDPSLIAKKNPAPNTNTNTTNTPANGNGNQQINKNEKHVQGKGTPPDGLYEVNKIYSQGYMYLGTLEIRGNTYRGLSQEGPFHPYSIDGAGGITWTAGLQGIPDGWSVDKGNYNGHDHTGKDWIQIRFQGFRNAEEIADAIHK